jgi:hypothetical protein
MPSLRHNGMPDYAYRGGENFQSGNAGLDSKGSLGLHAGIRPFRLGCQPATISLGVAALRAMLATTALPGAVMPEGTITDGTINATGGGLTTSLSSRFFNPYFPWNLTMVPFGR